MSAEWSLQANYKEDAGKIALQRGPIMLCAEWKDNNGKVSNIILPPSASFSTEFRPELLNGITVLKAEATAVITDGREGYFDRITACMCDLVQHSLCPCCIRRPPHWFWSLSLLVSQFQRNESEGSATSGPSRYSYRNEKISRALRRQGKFRITVPGIIIVYPTFTPFSLYVDSRLAGDKEIDEKLIIFAHTHNPGTEGNRQIFVGQHEHSNQPDRSPSISACL